MNLIGQQKLDLLPLVAVMILVAGALVVGTLVPAALPFAMGGIVAAAILLVWALKWDVTIWAWLWVLSYGLLEWPEWKVVVTGFFNITVPRIIFIISLLGFFVYFLAHQRRIRFDRLLFWAMLGLLGYVALSMQMTGWRAKTPDLYFAPYYRFIGSMFMPFLMFYLLYNSSHTEKHIRRGLILLTIYGWYALYTGYLQYIALRWAPAVRVLIWPEFINDANYGIHFDRARGAFFGVGPQGIFMVLLFFVDLYLIRKIRGPYRSALILQMIMVPPCLFFTGLRSAYVAFVICCMMWFYFVDRGRFAWIKIGSLLVVLMLLTTVFWDRLSTKDRLAGGVAEDAPIVARRVLVAQTWEIFKEAPVVGVGFGHFVDKHYRMELDPATWAAVDTGILVQHNLFLNMLAETGLIGLILTVLVFWLLFNQSRQLYHKLPPTATGVLARDFVVLFWIVFVNYLVDAMFRDPLWDVFSSGIFWCFAGLMVSYNRLLEPQPLELPIAPQLNVR